MIRFHGVKWRAFIRFEYSDDGITHLECQGEREMDEKFIIIAYSEAVEERDDFRMGKHVVPSCSSIGVGGSACVSPRVGAPAGCLSTNIDEVCLSKEVFHERKITGVAVDITAYQARWVALCDMFVENGLTYGICFSRLSAAGVSSCVAINAIYDHRAVG